MTKLNIESDAILQKKMNHDQAKKSDQLTRKLFENVIPESELARNLLMFTDRRTISRFLFLYDLYRQNVPLHGSIFEFGVRYGVNTCLLTSLRGILEPYNHNRKIVSFDTFAGFPNLDAKDEGDVKDIGDYGVPENYETYLESILEIHEAMAPIESIKKHELVKGDVDLTLEDYLEKHPETIISMAYFDFDIYKPTINSLRRIEKFLSPGAIIAFDEINTPGWPGETVAMREWIDGRNMPIRHSEFKAAAGYVIYQNH